MPKKSKKRRKISSEQPDEREAVYFPGTREYEYIRRIHKAEHDAVQIDDVHVDMNNKLKVIKDDDDDKEINVREYEKDEEVYNVERRKYRRQMSKYDDVPEVQKIVKDGIDKNIKAKDMHGEIYDDGISSDDFTHKVVSGYKHELDKLINTDNNGDGQVDEDDVYPGMRRMSKYM